MSGGTLTRRKLPGPGKSDVAPISYIGRSVEPAASIEPTVRAPCVFVVVPTYGERDNLPELVERLRAGVPDAHVVIVDDHSGDGTPEWVRSQPDHGRGLHLLARPRKEGIACAYIAGFRYALDHGADVVVQIDADLSHDPADVPRLVSATAGADLVLGTRYDGGVRVLNWPIARLMLSLAAARFVRIATGLPVSDPTGGFKAWRRQLLAAVLTESIRSNGYAFQIETTYTSWRRGARIAEVPVVFTERRSGDSKMTGAITREALIRVLSLGVARLRRSWK